MTPALRFFALKGTSKVGLEVLETKACSVERGSHPGEKPRYDFLSAASSPVKVMIGRRTAMTSKNSCDYLMIHRLWSEHNRKFKKQLLANVFGSVACSGSAVISKRNGLIRTLRYTAQRTMACLLSTEPIYLSAAKPLIVYANHCSRGSRSESKSTLH